MYIDSLPTIGLRISIGTEENGHENGSRRGRN